MTNINKLIRSTRSVLVPLLTILGSTAVGVLFVDTFLSAEHHARSIRMDMYGLIHWVGGLDVFVATAIGTVVFLIALAFFVRRLA